MYDLFDNRLEMATRVVRDQKRVARFVRETPCVSLDDETLDDVAALDATLSVFSVRGVTMALSREATRAAFRSGRGRFIRR